MDTERAQVGWGFWLWWVLASTVLGSALFYPVLAFFLPYAVYVFFSVIFALMGGAVGVPQWLVLQHQVTGAGRWVLATVVGSAVGGTLGFAANLAVVGLFDLYFSLGEPVSSLLFAAVLFGPIGPVVGIAQWRLVLRRQIDGVGWWVLASTVGLAVGIAVSFAVLEAVEAAVGFAMSGAVRFAMSGAVSLAVYGAITGAVLVWLLRQPAARELGSRQAAE